MFSPPLVHIVLKQLYKKIIIIIHVLLMSLGPNEQEIALNQEISHWAPMSSRWLCPGKKLCGEVLEKSGAHPIQQQNNVI